MKTEEEFSRKVCGNCGIIYYIPTQFEEQLKKCGNNFYCPNGHCRHYIVGESAEQKLERERRWRKEADARAEHLERRISGYKGHIAKLKKQASK